MERRVLQRKSWSDIHRDILEEILQKLTLVDYLKCRQICRSWRSAIDDALAIKRTSSYPHASQFPFLILFPHTFMYNCPRDPAINVILSDITQQDTSYTIPTKTWEGYFDFEGLHVKSVQGWLVFQKMEYQSLLLFFTSIDMSVLCRLGSVTFLRCSIDHPLWSSWSSCSSCSIVTHYILHLK
jgi:hypothetical protein